MFFVTDTIADIYVFFVLYNEWMVHQRARRAELRPEHNMCVFLFYSVTMNDLKRKKKKPAAGERREERNERGRDEEQQQQPSQSSHGYAMACMS